MNLSDNKIASLKASILLAAAAALMAGTALGTERLWVGESGASWYSDSSWSPAGKPGQTDTCIFRPDGELTVVISGGTSVCRVGELRFESGKTTFAYSSDTVGLYMGNTLTNILYVAGDAEAVVSNRFLSLDKTKRFRRTGKGPLTIVAQNNEWWFYNGNNVFAGCDFAEGETILAAGGNYPMKDYPVHIESGAVIRCEGGYRFRTMQNIDIDAGGLLDCGSKTQYAQSLTGAGCITNHEAFIMTLNAGVCTFAGQFFKKSTGCDVHFQARPSGMSDEDWGFVIGASNTFAKSRLTLPAGAGNTIRFAPGVGNFWIEELIGSAGQMLTLEDTDGNPVTIRAGSYNNNNSPRFQGKGDFLSSLSRAVVSSAMMANMTGRLGACNKATLTLGDNTAANWPDISGLGGFLIEDGTVALKNKNAGDVTVGGTTTFCRATSKLTATAPIAFAANATIRFEIPPTGLASGITPLSAPTITLGATTALSADVAAFRKTLSRKTRLTLATATATLDIPDATLAAANANAYATGCKFVKSGKSLILEVTSTGATILSVR